MTTLGLIAVILIIGCVLYFFPGLDGTLKKILIAIAVIVFILWLLGILGIFGGTDPSPIFHLRR